jgi:hypothetical protein
MNNDQPDDAASQQKRGRYESPTQWAPGIKPTMAAKDERYVSLQLGRLPSGQATPDPQDHCHLKEAAASGSSHAAHSKNLRHQQYRHSNLAAIRRIRRMVQRSGQDDSYYPAYPGSSTPKNRQLVPKVMPANPTKVGYRGVRL